MKFSKLREFDGIPGKILSWVESPWIALGVSLLLYAPISFAVLYYSVDSIKAATNKYLEPEIKVWLANHTLEICLSALVLAFLITHLSAFLRRVAEPDGRSTAALATISEGFENIVKAKAARFDVALNKLHKKELSHRRIFEEITRPEQQIVLMVHILHEVFSEISTRTHFKVRLYTVVDWQVSTLMHFAPDNCPPETDVAILKNPNSAISHALRKRRLFIIQDIRAEAKKRSGRRYVPSHVDSADEGGSLICYPVYHVASKTVPYILTISADNDYFHLSNKEFYDWVLGQFALRLNLEHTLLLLREGKSQA